MKTKAKIVSNDKLTQDVHMMTFEMEKCNFKRPGQYAIVEAGGLKRPYQVCSYDSNRFTIVFKKDGGESSKLADLKSGTEIEADTGLGKGFEYEYLPEEVHLVADETGISEMFGLARGLLVRGIKSKLLVSFPSKDSIYMVDSFRNLVSEIEVLTEDGSNGREGRASEGVRNANYVLACGSMDMLRDLNSRCENGQFSFSAYLQDDCPVETKVGRAYCREEGPVFDKNIIDWNKTAV